MVHFECRWTRCHLGALSTGAPCNQYHDNRAICRWESAWPVELAVTFSFGIYPYLSYRTHAARFDDLYGQHSTPEWREWSCQVQLFYLGKQNTVSRSQLDLSFLLNVRLSGSCKGLVAFANLLPVFLLVYSHHIVTSANLHMLHVTSMDRSLRSPRCLMATSRMQ